MIAERKIPSVAPELTLASAKPAAAEAIRFVLLPLKSFVATDLTFVIDALHEANVFSGRDVYSWSIASETGQPVTATNGMQVSAQVILPELTHRDTIIVISGEKYEESATLGVLSWLRRQARRGVRAGGIGSAAYTLAKAGLLQRNPASLHWSYRAAISETNPDLEVSSVIFENSEKRFTCAGGVSTLELMLQIIERDIDAYTAAWISDRLICSNPRNEKYEQRISDAYRLGFRHPKLAAAIRTMSTQFEDPLSLAEVAESAGISARQLERLFAKYLSQTPKKFYLQQRLENARALLQQTNMTVTEVALASGFTNASHFSRCYKRHFGKTPMQDTI
ncbi:MAG: GlxA family transcriptional regulator [Pseudomonadota bacterium]